MNSFLLDLSGAVFTLAVLLWRQWQQKMPTNKPLNSSAFANTRPPFLEPAAYASKRREKVTINMITKEFLKNIPRTIAIQRRILGALSIVEFKLDELERLLTYKGFPASGTAH
ncbi:kita-kyushu lung cancer antigen 1 [Tenrec ecaudatus]|uniref:kita-kyushu lung cancer antigen 1 n=1 Tax=Tenrec ecaudatus TaxID=94439 RepID=UPI003F59D9BA